MGALAVSMNWIPEDDRLLKNALEAGASLESLAKGAVKFSRKFTLCELQERWRCLLYDIDTSTKASAKILEIEMEQAASNHLNSNQAFTYNDNDSVRGHYYARQKRICVAPQSFDFGDQLKNEIMQVDSFNEVPEAHHFLNSYGNGMVGDDGSLFGYTGNNNMSCMSLDGIECDIGNPSIEENFQQSDFPHILGENLLSLDILNDSDSRSPSKYELEIQKLNSPDRGQPSSQFEMNVWKMDRGNDLNNINSSIVTSLDDYDNCNDNAGNNDIMSGAGFTDPPFMSDHDLTIFANTNMEDLLLINDNEVDDKNKLFSAELFDAPSATYHDLFNLIDPIPANLVCKYLGIAEQDVHLYSTQMNVNLKSVFGIDIPSNTSSKTTSNSMPCFVNMWPNIVPDYNNDDMSLLKEPSAISSSRHKKLKRKSSVLSFSDKNDSNDDLRKRSKPVVDVQHKACNSMANSVKDETSKVVSAPAQVNVLEEENQENFDDFGSYLENFLQENNDIHNNDLSMDTCQEGAKTRVLLQPETAAFDQEQSISENEDVPYTSDVEDMIIGMDLGQYDGESYPIAKEVSKYEQLDTKKLIRLEQSFHSHINRSIASNGAYAVFYGRHLKYFIKNPQVTIGRDTDDNQVDIDLQREGRANKVSRQQAIIKMDEEGVFYMHNLGKSSISVNGKEVQSKRCTKLPSESLIRIHGLQFMFEVYETAVRRYIIDNKHHTSYANKTLSLKQP